MSESAYRAAPIGLKSCTACGTPTDPARLVYAKSGDLVCSACETSADGEVRLARGALGSAVAAFVFGFIGTIALLLLAQSLLGFFDVLGHDHRWRKGETRMFAMWITFLGVVIGLGVRTIAGAHRTLGSPAVRRVLGSKRTTYLLLSWAGIPAVPVFGALYFASIFALAVIARALFV